MKSKYDGYTFKLDESVERKKVQFHNRYGITLTGDLYRNKSKEVKGAIAISGPFGAVKEQCSGLYANEMAKRGYLSLAFDPSFTGESTASVMYVASPDINTEDFSAAVDYLMAVENIDESKIGILGICGWGGMALNAASYDPRIKAAVASTMYDMSRVNANGYFDSMSKEDRYKAKESLSRVRVEDYKSGKYQRAGGVAEEIADDAPFFVKDYHDYYKTERGYAERSLNSNDGWNTTSSLSFMNMPILSYADEIKNAVLLIHGEKAHSRYFSEDAFKKLKGDNKELLIIPDAVHTDLYDNYDYIPFDKIDSFYQMYLK